MAIIKRVVRVKNPRRSRVSRNSRGRFVKRKAKRNSLRASTRKAPVIRRYSVKRLKQELKRRGVKSNPRRKRGIKRSTRRKNPVLIELGMVNPKRRSNVAKRRIKRHRRTNPRRHAVVRRTVRRAKRTYRRRRRMNPTVIVTRRNRRRRRNTRMVHRRRNIRHRNPSLFGKSSGEDLLTMVGGGLVGVAATKFLPTLLPSSIASSLGSSPAMGIVITGAGAFVAGWLAKKVSNEFGDAVLFGGLMQTASAALTAFAPSSIFGQFALSGIGDIVPGNYVVPQNPLRLPPPVVVSTGNGGMGSLRRAGNFR